MKIIKEFQPFFNKELNQPRTCIWIEAENISELRLLEKLNDSIISCNGLISGFTGLDKDKLLIQFPL